jgi:NAD(P)H-dependent FMN reductase
MVAENYQRLMNEVSIDSQIFSLEDLSDSFIYTEPYGKPGASFQAIIDEYILPIKKFVFIVPEYNGSFPGVMKAMLDVVHPSCWVDKKAAVVGIASGRAGNLRGIEHLAQVLNYLKINVYYHKTPFGQIDKMMNSNGDIINEEILKVIRWQIQGFSNF